MKLPLVIATFFAVLFIGTSSVAILASSAAPGSHPPRDHSLQVVMGRDFGALLGNPALNLRVREAPGGVNFEWTSESPARLEEVAELGRYMQQAKEVLEQQGPVQRPWQDFRSASLAPTDP